MQISLKENNDDNDDDDDDCGAGDAATGDREGSTATAWSAYGQSLAQP